ncbi:MAG: L,D-transpeptidase family protein [Acidobacteriia bacterium]|nr:L,D-transpeptidase family protein [Terriglobia bacterium]
MKRRLLAVAMVAGWMLFGAEINSAADLPRADQIVIVKSTRTLTLLRQGQVLKTYKVALGGQPVGAKDRQGDNKTPEGRYTIDSRNQHSQFHLSLHISYPSAADRQRARRLGVNPGGDIFIHGGTPAWTGPPAERRNMDWTLGCIAVTNPEIDEIWAMVNVGTRVEIRP